MHFRLFVLFCSFGLVLFFSVLYCFDLFHFKLSCSSLSCFTISCQKKTPQHLGMIPYVQRMIFMFVPSLSKQACFFLNIEFRHKLYRAIDITVGRILALRLREIKQKKPRRCRKMVILLRLKNRFVVWAMIKNKLRSLCFCYSVKLHLNCDVSWTAYGNTYV